MPRKNVRRAASKEALKQMQLLSATAYEDDDNDVETFEIASDDDIDDDDDDDDDVDDDESMEVPPKKKYRLSHRKSSDGNDRDVLVLKSVDPIEEPLKLEVWAEDLSEAQLAVQQKVNQEIEELNAKIDQLRNSMAADVVYQTDNCSAIEFNSTSVPPLTYTNPKKEVMPNKSYQKISLQTTNKGNNSKGSYKLVMDPRIGVIVGTMTPATNSALATSLITKGQTSLATAQSPSVIQTRQAKKRGRNSVSNLSLPQQPKQQKQPKHQTLTKPQSSLPISAAVIQLRPTESTAVGGLNTDPTLPLPATKQKTNNTTTPTIDLTADDGQSGSDTREVSFNKIQGRTYPSLIVVARPHLCVKDNASEDRNKLDSKVKSVLLHAPTKFTEWLIQQGLVRSEQSCVNHPNTKLKLGMYSDVTRFPYSGGYVWISECCPTRFVSVFSGSLFEGSPHPPSSMLKLIYHWACQTNVQNILQWVKVDNSYIKGINTWLRAICTVALHTHIRLLGGLGKRVEVGIISLGTTSQDGQQRQVKVEILGIIETDLKRIRLRAVEPVVDSDRNRRKRFIKILEPLLQWVHSDSTIVTDATVDKSTLFSMGFKHVIQASSTDNTGNRTVMEYLRRIVPRMFQNTLSLFSRQIIQQFLDELVWREWYGCTASLCFDNIIAHLSEQTRTDVGQSLIAHLNKVAANPFKNWSISPPNQQVSIVNKPKANEVLPSAKPYSSAAVLSVSTKRTSNRQRKVLIRNLSPPLSELQSSRPPRTISPDVPEQLVPLENYYYGTVEGNNDAQLKMNVEFTIKCSLCKGHFNNNIKLMNHLFSHAHSITGGIQQCRYCLSSVGSHDGLIKHIATSHPVETRFQDGYVCIICESRFPNSFGLGKHLSREHVPAELPYQCGTCNYRCSSHRQAIDHFYNLHDSGVTIQCPFCLKSTSIWSGGRVLPQNLNYFMQHLQKHQKKAMAKKCPKCALWFIHKDTLKDHQVNMHLTQRRKGGLVPWLPPTNGLMVPKSRQDKQVWEDGDREIDLNSLTINASNQLACKECKSGINSPKHFQSLESCLNRNCRYITCCKNAMEHHKTICKDLETSLPIHILPKQMHCVCGYSDDDGNILAKHLAECERKSAYPTAEAAKNAIKPNNMLDVLGLVRRLEEPLTPSAQEAKDPPIIAVIDLDDDDKEEEEKMEDGDEQKAREAEKIDEEVQQIEDELKPEEAKEQKVKEKEQKTEEGQTAEEEQKAKEEEEQNTDEQKAEKEEQKAEVEQMAEEDQKTDEDKQEIEEKQQKTHKEEQKAEDQKTDEEEQKTEEEEQNTKEEEQKAHKEEQKTEEEQKAEVEQMVEEDQKTVEKEQKMEKEKITEAKEENWTKEEERKVEEKEEEGQEAEVEEEQLKSDDVVQNKTEQTVDNNKIEDKQEKEEEVATKLKNLVPIEHDLEENGVTFAIDDSPKVDDDKHNKVIESDNEETPSGELDDREIGEPDHAMEVEEIMTLENNDKVIAGEEKMETDEDLTIIN